MINCRQSNCIQVLGRVKAILFCEARKYFIKPILVLEICDGEATIISDCNMFEGDLVMLEFKPLKEDLRRIGKIECLIFRKAARGALFEYNVKSNCFNAFYNMDMPYAR